MLWRSSHGWERQGRMACDVIGLCVTSTIVKSLHDQPGTSGANLLQESKNNLRTRTRSGVDRSDMHHSFSNSFMIILHVSFPARSVWVDVLQAVIWWELFFWLPLGILGILPACLPETCSTWVMMNQTTRKLSKMPEQVRAEVSPYYLNSKFAIPQQQLLSIPKLDDSADHIRSGLTVISTQFLRPCLQSACI
jgi:hypothetical protein